MLRKVLGTENFGLENKYLREITGIATLKLVLQLNYRNKLEKYKRGEKEISVIRQSLESGRSSDFIRINKTMFP